MSRKKGDTVSRVYNGQRTGRPANLARTLIHQPSLKEPGPPPLP